MSSNSKRAKSFQFKKNGRLASESKDAGLPFKFYHTDISGVVDIPQKYDFIYTSNLSDYVKKDKLVLYRENLYNHLNKGGIVLSSCLNGAETEQKRFMKKYFKYRKLFSYDENLCSLDLVGYRYKKRMVKRII